MQNVVEVKNVHKQYSLGSTLVRALNGVSLEIRKGEFTALIGASGSGKTTLLNLVGSLDVADQGDIAIEGVHLSTLNEDQKSYLRNEKIGFIFQSFNLIPVLTIFENVEVPLTIRLKMSREERQTRVMQALKDVGLESYAQHRPDQLSGGQRQRVAIARALVTEPSLILADEPTANLDSKTAHHIMDLMLDLNQKKNMTFFFCTHDEKLMSRVQRIVKIKDGVIEV
ncbi:MAG: ABC transporter ATP-binding protein [Bdellovibrionaceae bacterium]|nr:ABC transporter ATP-binding protein [Pseudobdellovibrionaceae bacterium]